MAIQKTTLRLFNFCVFSVLLTGSLFGQTNFKPGFIVTDEGDTLRGEVSFIEKSSTNDKVLLKRESFVRPYSPNSVRSFNYGGVTYISGEVEVDQTPLKVSTTGYFTPFTVEKDVFLREVIGGEMPLYHYFDFRPHYFIESGSALEELISNQYIVIRNNRRILVNRNEKLFQVQLEEEYPACTRLRIQNVSYNELSLKTFMASCALEYGFSVPTDPTPEYGSNRTVLKNQVFVGVEHNALEYLVPEWDSDLAPQIESKGSVTGFRIGGALAIERIRNQKRRAVIFGLDYAHYNASSEDEFESFGFISVTPSYVAYFSPKKISGLFEVGLPLSVRVGATGIEELDAETKFTPAFFLGGGVQYNRFFLKGRYEYKGKAGKAIQQRIVSISAGIEL